MSSALCRTLDGSLGEGGGQILRNAIAYSCILNLPLHIHSIRANRSKPGLKAQHLTGIRLVSQLNNNMVLQHDELHSTRISFVPSSTSVAEKQEGGMLRRQRHPSSFVADIGTAGSICLLIQAALPCCLFGSGECILELKGGTNAEMAPQIDYFTEVFLPIAGRCFGFLPNVHCTVVRRGYFPRGGGLVKLQTSPIEMLNPIRMTERGLVQSVHIRAFHAGKVSRKAAEDMAYSAKSVLTSRCSLLNFDPTCIQCNIVNERQAVGNGSGILIVAETSTGCILAGSALGSSKQAGSRTGECAAYELVDALHDGQCVDKWLQDQLILYMALANGTSEILTGSMTNHTKTAIMVAEQLTGASFEVEKLPSPSPSKVDLKGEMQQHKARDDYGESGGTEGRFLIRCHGISLVNKHRHRRESADLTPNRKN